MDLTLGQYLDEIQPQIDVSDMELDYGILPVVRFLQLRIWRDFAPAAALEALEILGMPSREGAPVRPDLPIGPCPCGAAFLCSPWAGVAHPLDPRLIATRPETEFSPAVCSIAGCTRVGRYHEVVCLSCVSRGILRVHDRVWDHIPTREPGPRVHAHALSRILAVLGIGSGLPD